MDEWLGASWTNELHDGFIDRKVKGTCDWIRERPAYLQWSSPEFPSGSAKILWVHGPPGFVLSPLNSSAYFCSRLGPLNMTRELSLFVNLY